MYAHRMVLCLCFLRNIPSNYLVCKGFFRKVLLILSCNELRFSSVSSILRKTKFIYNYTFLIIEIWSQDNYSVSLDVLTYSCNRLHVPTKPLSYFEAFLFKVFNRGAECREILFCS